MTTATRRDTARVVRDVLVPMLAVGVILRRPRVLAVAQRLDTDGRAVRRVKALRARYGDGPLLLRLPRRDVALVLAPDDVRRLLVETPEPFAAANREKQAALRHFQPHGVLISTGAERAERRRFTEDVLDTGQTRHRHSDAMTAVIRSELAELPSDGALGWTDFEACWWRIVRRIVLGDGARDDTVTTDLLRRLRADANWAYLRPRRHRARAHLDARMAHYVARAEPGSLAALAAATPASPSTDRAGQLPHWLFAFDAAGIAAWRTLALLAGHREALERVRAEQDPELPFARACVLEAVRLWPTTLAVLRDATTPTEWNDETLPAGTALVIVSAAFHRDPDALGEADRFAPELWLDSRGEDLFPFSAGPARCPGRDVVLHTTATLVGALAGRIGATAGPVARRLRSGERMPGTLDHTGLRLTLSEASAMDQPRVAD